MTSTSKCNFRQYKAPAKTCQNGFTLVEILVSLAIVAVVLGALIQAAASTAANTGRLRDRTVAHWVGSNRLAEMRLADTFPATGSRDGNTDMLGITWHWKTVVAEVEDDDLRRVDIEVRRNENDANPIVRVAGFVAHPRLFSQIVTQN